eukprot:1495411-Rhodomonas_salina.2
MACAVLSERMAGGARRRPRTYSRASRACIDRLCHCPPTPALCHVRYCDRLCHYPPTPALRHVRYCNGLYRYTMSLVLRSAMPAPCYASPTPCPVPVHPAIVLRRRYAMSGTETGYAAIVPASAINVRY